ncbi:MAG: hypothetical protein U5L06_14840 [Rhodovibrio sp.]|nr:hypothetical protein [Rhodovibrio sp.]
MPRTVHDPHAPPTRGDADASAGGDAHVSGIVVHARQAHAHEVAGWIDTLAGAEVAAREGGRLARDAVTWNHVSAESCRRGRASGASWRAPTRRTAGPAFTIKTQP